MSSILDYRPSANTGSRPSVFPMLMINGKKSVSNPERISWSPPFAWSTIIPSVRRQESIEGAIIGCALGESIAGLSRSKRARFAANPAAFEPSKLVPSHGTEGMLVTVQSLLLSQAMSEIFVMQLKNRLGWYQITQPIAYVKKVVGSLVGSNRFSATLGDDPLARAVVLSVLMQGHHDGALSWVQDSTQMSFNNRWVTQASFLVATAAQVAQLQRTRYEAKVCGLLEDLKLATGSKEIEQRLESLIQAKEQAFSVLQASHLLGGNARWQDHLVDNALLAIYTYVKHPNRIEDGLGELSQLRGSLRGVMSLYGALSTIHTSVSSVPAKWQERLSLYPYSSAWIQQCVDRCGDWPHGPEDIQATRCLPSHQLGQLIRNIRRGCL
ncbi:MAG: ADP-ribosylglycohydrolase family protein [Planctomycetaceae bacterium]|jgi:hypothetical protein|nr:ADP-ribosylglycohydrolase family protein [Planctomycetaceae bacterium]